MSEVITAQPVAADLEAWELEQEEAFDANQEHQIPELPVLDTDEAARLMKRVRYFRRMAAKAAGPFDEEIALLKTDIANLQAEVARLESVKAVEVARWTRRESWYTAPLEAFMRALKRMDAKIKSWGTPFGKLTLTKQQPEWKYGDEKALGEWLKANAPEYVKPVPMKAELKKAADVREDGTVVLKASGEIVPGVTVDSERPDKFDLQVD